MSDEQPEWRNPFRNEADAFRVLVMIISAALVVIAAAEIVGSWLGVTLALIFISIGLYFAGGWLWVGLQGTDDDDSGEPPA